MRIPLFAHDANPRVDRPLCYKSHDQIVRMLEDESIKLLYDKKGREFGVQFLPVGEAAERTLQSQLEAYMASEMHNLEPAERAEIEEILLSRSEESTTGITDADCKANAGIVDSRSDGLEAALILRARNKVAAWPHIRDDRNISVSGARFV